MGSLTKPLYACRLNLVKPFARDPWPRSIDQVLDSVNWTQSEQVRHLETKLHRFLIRSGCYVWGSWHRKNERSDRTLRTGLLAWRHGWRPFGPVEGPSPPSRGRDVSAAIETTEKSGDPSQVLLIPEMAWFALFGALIFECWDLANAWQARRKRRDRKDQFTGAGMSGERPKHWKHRDKLGD